jgi:PhzF family phenazine biosynthesis protein
VCLLEAWPSDDRLQAIAEENSLPETAFVLRAGSAWELRWFTPRVEVPLCGHATLASAHVLTAELGIYGAHTFLTRSGPLRARPERGAYTLDLPARDTMPAPQLLPQISAALGLAPESVFLGTDLVAVLRDAAALRALRPDLAAIERLPGGALVVTAPSDRPDTDFVSRVFAPGEGIPEDPVTGSAHCTLAPYWATRLDRPDLRAAQLSARGGILECRVRGERVELQGDAITVLRGRLLLPG